MSTSAPPLKRPRRTPSPTRSDANGHNSNESPNLPPLSLSILGIEPLDEFIKEIADFVHHMITTRPDHLHGKVEVEAKIGILRDRMSGQRISLPVLVETSICYFPIRCNNTAFVDWLSLSPLPFLYILRWKVLDPESADVRFESNMSIVRFTAPTDINPCPISLVSCYSTNTNTITPSSIA